MERKNHKQPTWQEHLFQVRSHPMSFARTISRNGAVFPHSADNETASPVKQLKEAGNARGEEEHFQKKKKGQQVQTVRLGVGGCPPCRKSKPCSPSGAEGRPGKPQHKPREAAGGSVEGHVLLTPGAMGATGGSEHTVAFISAQPPWPQA